MGAKIKYWTKEEEDYLKENSSKLSAKELAKTMDRTEVSIAAKRESMELASSTNLWTEEDELYLSDNWGTLSVEKLASKLNRTEDAIIVKKNKMGLGRFLDSGEYITFLQFLQAIKHNGLSGKGNGYTYKITSWVEKRGFPLKIKKVNNCSFRVVYLDDFWKWADKNRSFINWSLLEAGTLGKEPEWVKPLRKEQYKKSVKFKTTQWTADEEDYLKMLVKSYKYSWKEISEKLQRTEGAVQRRLCDLGIKDRPIKADNHNRWTAEQLKILGECIKLRLPYEMMGERIDKSARSIRGAVYRMYMTERIDEAALIMGDGEFGDNRPDRPISHKTLNTSERMAVKKDMTTFVQLLRGEICKHYDDNDYWQREICQHWNGYCEAGELNCDECTSFIRLRPQYCKRCGTTFTDRNKENFCHRCRDQRKKQAQRKYAVLQGKRVYNFDGGE